MERTQVAKKPRHVLQITDDLIGSAVSDGPLPILHVILMSSLVLTPAEFFHKKTQAARMSQNKEEKKELQLEKRSLCP